MREIEIAEQRRADEVLRLEIAYSNLYKAYSGGNRDEMILAVDAALRNNPQYTVAFKKGVDKVFVEHYGCVPIISNWNLISDADVKLNVEGYMKAINDKLSLMKFYESNYTHAQEILFSPNHIFYQDDVLYQNHCGQSLKVADLLAVSKYAVSIAEAIDPSNDEYAKANAAITVFQGIDAILNNKPDDKPVNKMLHLATSFISSVVKSSVKDNETKRGVTITTIMIDFAIDFFCKK